MGSMASRLRAAGLLAIVYTTMPFAVMWTCIAVLLHILWRRPQPPRPSSSHVALVTGGKMCKALEVCRVLHQAGVRVILVEERKYRCAARLSTAVHVFFSVPKPEHQQAYIRALAAIAAAHHVTLFVPVSAPKGSVVDAMAAQHMPKGCVCWCASPDDTLVLDNKATFSAFCTHLGLPVPHSICITSPQQLTAINDTPQALASQRYVLKSVVYAAVQRRDLFTLPTDPTLLYCYLHNSEGPSISPASPWLLQRFVQGPEFAAYALVRNGTVLAYADNQACMSCMRYAQASQADVWSWVQFSGQLCIDFLREASTGQLYAIECNPRTSTCIMQFRGVSSALAAVLTDPIGQTGPVVVPGDTKEVYWFFHEAWASLVDVCRNILCHRRRSWDAGVVRAWLERLQHGMEALFDCDDPLPFLAMHYEQIPSLLLRLLCSGRRWVGVDLCIGKVVEAEGD